MTVLSRVFFQWEQNLSRRDTNRKVREFDWGLEFVNGSMAPIIPSMRSARSADGTSSADSKSRLLEYAHRAVEESEAYHSYEAVRDFRLDGDRLTFTSPVASPHPRNNTVHGRFFPADSRGRVVLVLPQWNSDPQGHMSLCRLLNAFGLSALRLSLPYHDLRMPEELVRADYMLSPNLGRTLHAMRQAVIDARAALDWLELQGYSKFAILGTSIGSCVGFITAAHDPRLSVTIQNHISPYFADVVWHGISTRHVRKSLDGNIALEDLRKIWMPISPKAYVRKLVGTHKKTLLVHALYDYTFPHRLSREVLQDFRDYNLPHSTFALRCGHYTSGVFPFNIVLGCTMCRYISRQL